MIFNLFCHRSQFDPQLRSGPQSVMLEFLLPPFTSWVQLHIKIEQHLCENEAQLCPRQILAHAADN